MSNENHIDPDDRELFRSHLEGVRPTRQDKIAPSKSRVKPTPRQSLLEVEQVKTDMLALDQSDFEVETGEELQFARPGLQNKVRRNLRRGQYVVEAELDLHGLTVAEAGPRLNRFLQHANNNGSRCVRIIHGKGHGSRDRQPVLKHQVNNWLRRREDILAFCSARPYDGGTGAVYVLLRR